MPCAGDAVHGRTFYKNNSVAYFDSPMIETIIGIFMLLGSLPMTYFVLIAKKRSFASVIENNQVNTF